MHEKTKIRLVPGLAAVWNVFMFENLRREKEKKSVNSSESGLGWVDGLAYPRILGCCRTRIGWVGTAVER